MKERKSWRGEVYLDSIDLDILTLLNNYRSKDIHIKGMKVLDIAEELGIKHQSLKPHLDKLLAVGLIVSIVYQKKGTDRREVLLVSTEEYLSIRTDQELELDEDTKRTLNSVVETKKMLQRIRKYLDEKDTSKSINFDLRKKDYGKTKTEEPK
jgi:predicted ArsR family transcriptional regulator